MELKQGYKQTELGMIPEDWELKELGEIGTFKNGINKGSEDFGFGYPFVNLMDVFGKSSISSNENFGLINSTEIERKTYDLKIGDVLFIRSSVKPSGVGLTCVIENNLPNVVFSGFIIRYRDNYCLDTEFKRHCFYDERFRNNLIGGSTVSANTNINQETLKKLQIPLPTLSEQKAIATVLSDTDALISSIEKLITKKRNIKQGAMQKLLSPKDGWEVKKLGEVAEMSSGGTPLTTNSIYYNGAIPWCVIADLTIAGKYIERTAKSISVVGINNSSAKLFKKGVILFAMYASIGKCSISKIDISCNQAILGIEVKSIDREYLYYFLHYRELDFSKLGQTGTQSNLNKEIVKELDIPFPPIKEQTQIASILSDMDEEIVMLETKLAKYKNIKQGMMQNLLTGRIRLVNQNG